MDSLPRPAPRPRNSKLKCLLSEAIGLPPLPHWQEGLAHFVEWRSPAFWAETEPFQRTSDLPHGESLLLFFPARVLYLESRKI